jgi:hypothetical protein
VNSSMKRHLEVISNCHSLADWHFCVFLIVIIEMLCTQCSKLSSLVEYSLCNYLLTCSFVRRICLDLSLKKRK